MYDTFLFAFSFIIPLVFFGIIFRILEKKSLMFDRLFGTIAVLFFVIALIIFLGFLEFVLMVAGGII